MLGLKISSDNGTFTGAGEIKLGWREYDTGHAATGTPAVTASRREPTSACRSPRQPADSWGTTSVM